MSIVGDIQTYVVRLWLWFKTKVEERKAEPFLVGLSFFESFLIAIPLDPFLAAMVLADRARWKYLAFISAVSSTVGAAVGYIIGFFAFDLIGQWFIGVAAGSDFLSRLVFAFEDHAVMLTFAAALTPLPNGPVVVAAGFVGTNFLWFLIAWAVARALRFFGVAYIVYAFGTQTLSKTERAFNIATVAITLLVLGWFVWRAAGI